MNPTPPDRKTVRLKEWSYANGGWYFITLVTHHRQLLFGRIIDGAIVPNGLGDIIHDEWERIPRLRPEIELDEYVIMPNHIHGIVVITEGDPRPDSPSNADSADRAHGRVPLVCIERT